MIKNLLKDYLTLTVIVATNLMQAVQLPDGEVTDIPVMVEGILLDFDKSFILIGGATNPEEVELINRQSIVSIKPVNPMQSQMDAMMSNGGKGATN